MERFNALYFVLCLFILIMEEFIDYMNNSTAQLMKEQNERIEKVMMEGLELHGLTFNNKQEIEEFAKNRVTAKRYLELLYYCVDGKPFFVIQENPLGLNIQTEFKDGKISVFSKCSSIAP